MRLPRLLNRCRGRDRDLRIDDTIDRLARAEFRRAARAGGYDCPACGRYVPDETGIHRHDDRLGIDPPDQLERDAEL